MSLQSLANRVRVSTSHLAQPTRCAVLRMAVGTVLCIAIAACEPAPPMEGNSQALSTETLSAEDSTSAELITINVPPEVVVEWQFEREPAFVALEAAATVQTTVYRDVRWLSDGRLVAASSNGPRLLILDSLGTVLQSFGDAGDAPGALRSIVTLAVGTGDTISTYDSALLRLSFWHPDNGFARHVSLETSDDDAYETIAAWPWQDSLIVAQRRVTSDRRDWQEVSSIVRESATVTLALLDGAGAVLRTRDHPGGYTWRGPNRSLLPAPLSNQPFAALSRDRLYFGSGTEFRVSGLDSDFKLRSIVHWPQQQEPVTQAEVARIRAEIGESVPFFTSPEAVRDAFDRTTSRTLLPRTRPAIGRALVDDAGRVWLGRFEPFRFWNVWPTPPERWTILDASGTPVATVNAPPKGRIEAVRGNRAVVVLHDSLERESIAVYQLRR